jgi:hypothetical protein
MQSGYARQYLFKDLFKVFLGGVFLGHLKLSVADSRKVLDDLTPWMGSNGFLDVPGREKNGTGIFSNDVWICFCPLASPGSDAEAGFQYLIRSVVDAQSADSDHGRRTVVTYEDEFIPGEGFGASDVLRHPDMHGINLSALYASVISKLLQ